MMMISSTKIPTPSATVSPIANPVTSTAVRSNQQNQVKNWRLSVGPNGKPSQSYGASAATWDHTVLLATRNRWTRPALTQARLTDTRFTYPGGMEGWVVLGVSYILRLFTCPQTVTPSSSNHLIATRPGVKSTTSRSQVNVLAVTRPSHQASYMSAQCRHIMRPPPWPSTFERWLKTFFFSQY